MPASDAADSFGDLEQGIEQPLWWRLLFTIPPVEPWRRTAPELRILAPQFGRERPEGLLIPEEFQVRPSREVSMSSSPSNLGFRILDHVGVHRQRSGNWWTQCPSCAERGCDTARDNLAISVANPRYYKCWAGCSKEMIRAALGCPVSNYQRRDTA